MQFFLNQIQLYLPTGKRNSRLFTNIPCFHSRFMNLQYNFININTQVLNYLLLIVYNRIISDQTQPLVTNLNNYYLHSHSISNQRSAYSRIVFNRLKTQLINLIILQKLGKIAIHIWDSIHRRTMRKHLCYQADGNASKLVQNIKNCYDKINPNNTTKILVGPLLQLAVSSIKQVATRKMGHQTYILIGEVFTPEMRMQVGLYC